MRRRSVPKKTVKKAARRPKTRATDAGLPEEVVALLFDQLSSEERSERAWREIFSAEKDEDLWSGIEEHLTHKPHEHNHRLRRWKYFAK